MEPVRDLPQHELVRAGFLLGIFRRPVRDPKRTCLLAAAYVPKGSYMFLVDCEDDFLR